MQVIVFSFIAKLVDPGKLPVYGGTVPSYLAFVVIGLVVNLTAGRAALPGGQLAAPGTADRARSRRCWRRRPSGATLQLGSVAYTLMIVPIRAAVLLAAIGLAASAWTSTLSGVVPALALLLCFLPFTWGLGLISRRPRGHVPPRRRTRPAWS